MGYVEARLERKPSIATVKDTKASPKVIQSSPADRGKDAEPIAQF
jgi:hypothetical protein